MVKRIALLIISGFLIPLFLTAPVHAAHQGDVTGTFSINVKPMVDSVALAPVSLTPQTQYAVSVTVSDPDKINDLSTLVLKLWYDAAGGVPTEAAFDIQTASAQNCAVITWTAVSPGGTEYGGSAALTPSGTTWSLGTSTLPIKGQGHNNPGDFGLNSFTFQFVFTVGKTATQTTDTGKWQIAAKVTDSVGQTCFDYDLEGSTMNWYGEINVPATTVDFGLLGPGTDFSSPSAMKSLEI